MNLGLKDKVVIVTWDSKGMVGEIPNLLAAEGAIPVLVGRKQKYILDVVKIICDNNSNASYAFAEVTSLANCKDVVASVKREFGRIDGFENRFANKGIGLESINYKSFQNFATIHLVIYYKMVHYAIPKL